MCWIEIWAMMHVIGASVVIFIVVTFLLMLWADTKRGK